MVAVEHSMHRIDCPACILDALRYTVDAPSHVCGIIGCRGCGSDCPRRNCPVASHSSRSPSYYTCGCFGAHAASDLAGCRTHLTVWHGSALVLRVGAPDAPAATFSISASPAPARGTLSIDAKSGLLRYAPAPTDLDEFDLTISSSSGRSQTIRVLPLPVLPPSAEVVQTTPPFDLTTQPNPDACDDLSANPYGTCPDAASKAYQTYTIRVASQSVWFNDGEYTPRDIMITGKRVNLEKSIGNVIAALDAKPDIRSLTICADTVVVRDAFSFPLTALTLYARRLVFEDPDPSKASYIN